MAAGCSAGFPTSPHAPLSLLTPLSRSAPASRGRTTAVGLPPSTPSKATSTPEGSPSSSAARAARYAATPPPAAAAAADARCAAVASGAWAPPSERTASSAMGASWRGAATYSMPSRGATVCSARPEPGTTKAGAEATDGGVNTRRTLRKRPGMGVEGARRRGGARSSVSQAELSQQRCAARLTAPSACAAPPPQQAHTCSKQGLSIVLNICRRHRRGAPAAQQSLQASGAWPAWRCVVRPIGHADKGAGGPPDLQRWQGEGQLSKARGSGAPTAAGCQAVLTPPPPACCRRGAWSEPPFPCCCSRSRHRGWQGVRGPGCNACLPAGVVRRRPPAVRCGPCTARVARCLEGRQGRAKHLRCAWAERRRKHAADLCVSESTLRSSVPNPATFPRSTTVYSTQPAHPA